MDSFLLVRIRPVRVVRSGDKDELSFCAIVRQPVELDGVMRTHHCVFLGGHEHDRTSQCLALGSRVHLLDVESFFAPEHGAPQDYDSEICEGIQQRSMRRLWLASQQPSNVHLRLDVPPGNLPRHLL